MRIHFFTPPFFAIAWKHVIIQDLLLLRFFHTILLEFPLAESLSFPPTFRRFMV